MGGLLDEEEDPGTYSNGTLWQLDHKERLNYIDFPDDIFDENSYKLKQLFCYNCSERAGLVVYALVVDDLTQAKTDKGLQEQVFYAHKVAGPDIIIIDEEIEDGAQEVNKAKFSTLRKLLISHFRKCAQELDAKHAGAAAQSAAAAAAAVKRKKGQEKAAAAERKRSKVKEEAPLELGTPKSSVAAPRSRRTPNKAAAASDAPSQQEDMVIDDETAARLLSNKHGYAYKKGVDRPQDLLRIQHEWKLYRQLQVYPDNWLAANAAATSSMQAQLRLLHQQQSQEED
jgi:uncharacterized protein YdaU (DUF1376 family)